MPTPKIPASERRRCAKACRNCRMRKERCDGAQPCRRCTARQVEGACVYAPITASRRAVRTENPYYHRQNASSVRSGTLFHTSYSSRQHRLSPPSDRISLNSMSSSLAGAERILAFCHDSTNSTYLHTIRFLVKDSLGPCRLVDSSRQIEMVKGFGPSAAETYAAPPKPDPTEVDLLVDWCMLATSAMLCAVDPVVVKKNVSQWFEADSKIIDLTDAAHYLILSLGAQASSEEDDDRAEKYFQYGRQLTMSLSLDTHNILTIQCYIWMTLYLLAACRIEAAADAIGIAARAAYTVGLNHSDFSNTLSEGECTKRRRLWKTLRKLDLFIGIVHGRPTATMETHDVNAMDTYSSVLSLSKINENVHVDLYLRRNVSRTLVQDIAEQQRSWASRFPDGLCEDGIAYSDICEGIYNLPLTYVKGSYYWSIMLLTRPFLLESVSARISRDQVIPHSVDETTDETQTDAVLAQACVISAIKAIDLIQSTLSSGNIPKRLPFATSLVSAAALTVGIAVFADLDRDFPLSHGLDKGQTLLSLFESHDISAKFYRAIVQDLQQAHDIYVERRSRQAMASRERMVCKIFGGLSGTRVPSPPRTHQPYPDLDMTELLVDWRAHGTGLSLEDFSVADPRPSAPNRHIMEDDSGMPSTMPCVTEVYGIDDILGMPTPRFLDTYMPDIHSSVEDL